MKALISFIFLLYSVTLSSQERITLLFVGDLMQHRAQIDAARTSDGKYDYSPCFSLVKEEISRADIAIGNLEVTLGGKPYQGYPTFSAPDEYLQAIKDAGVYQETVAVRNVDNYVFPYAANLHFVQRIYQILISRLVHCLNDDGRSVFS